jgi:hypothetical protein
MSVGCCRRPHILPVMGGRLSLHYCACWHFRSEKLGLDFPVFSVYNLVNGLLGGHRSEACRFGRLQ